MQIPTVDYTADTAAAEFTSSLKNTGFSVLSNHPIDFSLISAVYSEWESFFDSKQKQLYLFDLEKQDG